MAPVDYSPPANLHLTPQATSVAHSQHAKTGRVWRDYTVRPGDSLAKLAAKYDTTISALVAKNKIENPRMLVTGTKLKVPGAAPKRSAAPPTRAAHPERTKAKATKPTRWTRTHTVRQDETVSGIAARYDTTSRAVLKANKIADPRLVRPGEKLKVPNQKKATPKATAKNTFLGRTYPSKVVAQAAANRHTLQHRTVPTRSQTRALVVRTAQQYGVSPRLALGVAWQESGWNQRAVSIANAVGVMQVMPGTGDWCARMVGRDLDLLDPHDNVAAGVVFLRWLTQHADSPEEAIAGYYQGLGSVQQRGMYDDTKAYVKNVKAHMDRL